MASEPLLTVARRSLNGNHAEFVVAGEVDASTHEMLRSQLLAAVEAGAKDVVIDFQDVTFLDSSGLHGLIQAIQLGAKLTLRHPRPAVQKVFDIVAIPGLIVES